MSVDQSILTALTAALSADSENNALRLHLATLLLEGGQPAEALLHYTHILAKQPDHLDALSHAAKAAEAAGFAERAESYRRLYEALSWKQTKGLLDSLGEPSLPEAPPLPDLGRGGQVPPDDRPMPIPQRVGGDEEEDEDEGRWETERPESTLADVAGVEGVK